MINLAAETGIAELEVQRGDNRVRIRRASFAAPQEIVLAPTAYAAAPAPAPAPTAVTGPPPASSPQPIPTVETQQGKPADPGLVLVKSPIVGTFYESPSPGSPPFVRVGERVQPGKVLCIIESMKLMNEIEAETSGILESKLVMNGQPVEYGEALFAVRSI
ncbi:acetyl CoA carboxylase, BCCP subunit [Candidatus Sulfopaludibacter sp. SbA3]|nr:acetyl CoA carboxylase, BCCP subunit [Candidatus Sulfopaludibacter sp. SbA3]